MRNKSFIKLAALVIAVAVLLEGCSLFGDRPPDIISSTRFMGQAKSFYISAEEYFALTGTNKNIDNHKNVIDEILNFAEENQLRNIFFEVKGSANTLYSSNLYEKDRRLPEDFDPLGYMAEEAKKKGLALNAAVDVFSVNSKYQDGNYAFEKLSVNNGGIIPDSNTEKLIKETVSELSGYDIKNIAVMNMDAPHMEEMDSGRALKLIDSAVKGLGNGKKLIVSYNAVNNGSFTAKFANDIADKAGVEMLLMNMNCEFNTEADGYVTVADEYGKYEWQNAELYTLNKLDSENIFKLENELLANAVTGKIGGSVIKGFRALKKLDETDKMEIYSLFSAGTSKAKGIDLSISQELSISYPQNNATVYDDKIFLMGTSNPNEKLYCNGKEAERFGDLGTYGILVDLKAGKNSITVKQGSDSVTVNVTRKTTPSASQPITKIPSGALFPTTDIGIDSNETVKIVVTGPSGASISATVDGKTVPLKQKYKASSGVPTVFEGPVTFRPSEFGPDEIKNIGKITYVVGFNGNNSVQTSKGEIIVAGRNVPLVVETERYVTALLNKVSEPDEFDYSLKSGARARVAGKAVNEKSASGYPEVYYKLSNGKYLSADLANVVMDYDDCYNDIDNIDRFSDETGETYVFSGGQPAVLGNLSNDVLTLTFLDSKFTADTSYMAGGDIEAVTEKDLSRGKEFKIKLAADTFSGYNIAYDNNEVSVFIKRRKQLSDDIKKPLDGIKIVVDPGHGGVNPGAVGVAGTLGPCEAELNDAVAMMLRFRLEQMGAEVVMTREPLSESIDINDRNFFTEEEMPDIFVSVHHNSVVLNKEVNDTRRMEVYYWEDDSEELAYNIMEASGLSSGRNKTTPKQEPYYVTRLTFAPAVLFECGFVVSPYEYEESCKDETLYTMANGIASGILHTVRETF